MYIKSIIHTGFGNSTVEKSGSGNICYCNRNIYIINNLYYIYIIFLYKIIIIF